MKLYGDVSICLSEHSSSECCDLQLSGEGSIQISNLAANGDVCRHFPFGAAWVIFVRFMTIMPAGDSAHRSNTGKVFNAFWLSSFFFNAADEL